MNDPVVRDINQFINRSAGQHSRRISEGIESARRLNRQSDCGFGSCAGDPQCHEHYCPEHPTKTGMLGLPVIDPQFFDQQIKALDIPIHRLEPIPTVIRDAGILKTALLIVALVAAFACTLYVSIP